MAVTSLKEILDRCVQGLVWGTRNQYPQRLDAGVSSRRGGRVTFAPDSPDLGQNGPVTRQRHAFRYVEGDDQGD